MISQSASNRTLLTVWVQSTFRRLLSVVLCSVIVVFGLFSSFSTAAFAAPTNTPIASPSVDSSSAPGANIAAEKIDQFAQAYLQVLQLLSDRESEIPAAETNAEALKIERSIESDAIALIQDSGLTMPEYMQILGLASQDAAFQDKVLGRMDESSKDS